MEEQIDWMSALLTKLRRECGHYFKFLEHNLLETSLKNGWEFCLEQKKEEAIRVYSNISFCITQTEGFLTEREKVVYFSLVKRILDDAESAIRQLDDEMKKLLKNEESKQIDNVGNKIEIEYARIKAEMKSF